MLSADVLLAVNRFATYVSLFLLVGSTGLGLRLSADLGAATDRLRTRAVAIAMAAATILTLTSLGALYAQTWQFFGADEGVHFETIRIIAFETGWGAGWRVQFGAASFALLGALAVRMGVAAGWPVLGIGGLVAAGAQALTGHAVESSWWSPTVAAQSIHVIGAALWIGSLMAIANIVLRTESDDVLVTTVIERFSPVAIAAVAGLALAGLVSVYYYLATPSDLWSTVYGRVLSAKLVAFGMAAALGHHNWRRIRPRLPDPTATTELRRSVTAELGVALVVLVLTAFLVALPLPAWGL